MASTNVANLLLRYSKENKGGEENSKICCDIYGRPDLTTFTTFLRISGKLNKPFFSHEIDKKNISLFEIEFKVKALIISLWSNGLSMYFVTSTVTIVDVKSNLLTLNFLITYNGTTLHWYIKYFIELYLKKSLVLLLHVHVHEKK